MSGPLIVALGSTGLMVLQVPAEGLDWTARLRHAEITRKTENGHSDNK
jgi:hypothetical protein